MEHPKTSQKEEVLPDQEVMNSIQDEIRSQSRKRVREEPEPSLIPKRITRNQGHISDTLAALYKKIGIITEKNPNKR